MKKIVMASLLTCMSFSVFSAATTYECIPEYGSSLKIEKVVLTEKTKTIRLDVPTQVNYLEMKVQNKNSNKKLTFLNESLLKKELSDFRNLFNGGESIKGMIFKSEILKKDVMANLEFVIFGGSQRHRLYLTLAIDGKVVENLSCN